MASVMNGFVHKHLWVRLVLVLVVTAGFAVGVQVTYDRIIYEQNASRLAEIGAETLHRAELSADYAIITLSDFAGQGLGRCDAASLQKLRDAIFLRGTIKDVIVLGKGDKVKCSGLPLGEQSTSNWALNSRLDGEEASNSSISFHVMGPANSGILGVSWRFGNELTYLAIFNVDSLIFNALPTALREQGQAELLLGDEVFAVHQPETRSIAPVRLHTYRLSSSRYPFSVRLSVPVPALAAWNHAHGSIVAIIGAVVGLIMGLLLVMLLSRPPDMAKLMRRALKRGEFVPFVQPVFGLMDRQIVGCEVLTRWVRADGCVIPPYKFIPQAEATGLIVPLTRHIVTNALNEMALFLRRSPSFKVAFNIVPADMTAPGFVEEFAQLVDKTGVDYRQIVLELTERQPFEEVEQAVKTIAQLRGLGFGVALDDTGTGHNGLSYVQILGADTLKIDKHFVDFVDTDRSARLIVQMLVRLAGELGMRTLAEGVEREAQVEALIECGVDKGQGFLVSPPIPIESFLNREFAGKEKGFKMVQAA